MSKPLSKRVGELFAHIQDLFDTAAHSAIQSFDEKSGKKNRLLRFFSSAGNAYFSKYNEIKKRKESNLDS